MRLVILFVFDDELPVLGLLHPTTQQAAQFQDHATHMLILTLTQPAPLKGEAQIMVYPAQGAIPWLGFVVFPTYRQVNIVSLA